MSPPVLMPHGIVLFAPGTSMVVKVRLSVAGIDCAGNGDSHATVHTGRTTIRTRQNAGIDRIMCHLPDAGRHHESPKHYITAFSPSVTQVTSEFRRVAHSGAVFA